MKKILSLLLVIPFLILGLPACAAPLPATPITLSWTASPDADAGLVLTYVVYEWKPSDTNWLVLQVTAPSALSLQLTNPAYGTRYTVTAKDATGQESPMSNVATNLYLALPGGLRLSR